MKQVFIKRGQVLVREVPAPAARQDQFEDIVDGDDALQALFFVDHAHDREVEVGHQPGDLLDVRLDRDRARHGGEVDERVVGRGTDEVRERDRPLQTPVGVHHEDRLERLRGRPCEPNAVECLGDGGAAVDADEIGAHQPTRRRRPVTEESLDPPPLDGIAAFRVRVDGDDVYVEVP